MSDEIAISAPDLRPDGVVNIVETCVADAGLQITLKGSLASYPGSVHWHVKPGRERGVLEITYWPQERRLWFSVHRNRSAPWIEAVQPQLEKQIRLRLE